MNAALSSADEAAGDGPIAELPLGLGRERRMHARAFAHWDTLRMGGICPRLTVFDPRALADAEPHSFLIALGDARHRPQVHYLGRALAEEVGASEGEIDLARLPRTSLLAQLVRQLPRVADGAAPLAFEYDGPGAGDVPTHHRGILLPFADPSGMIAYVQGIVGWRRAAAAPLDAGLAAAIDAGLQLAPLAVQPSPWSLPSAVGAAPLSLDQLLAAARTWVALADADRLHSAHHVAAALSATHDLLLAGDADPSAFDRLDGLHDGDPFDRAIRLVFGAGLAALARIRHRAILAHARRLGLGSTMLLALIQRHRGGLSALIRAEARYRRRIRGGAAPALAWPEPIRLTAVDPDRLHSIAARPSFAAWPESQPARAVG